MILYVTDRGQCYWSSILRTWPDVVESELVTVRNECVVVTRYLFGANGRQLIRQYVGLHFEAGARISLIVRIS